MIEEDGVLAVLDRFRQGWETLDAGVVLDCFAADPQITVIGTDEDEYWHGFVALIKPLRSMVGAFADPVYSWVERPHIQVAGDLAWADGRLDTSVTTDGERVAVQMRTSWVLRRRDRWEIVQAHFSVAPTARVAAY